MAMHSICVGAANACLARVNRWRRALSLPLAIGAVFVCTVSTLWCQERMDTSTLGLWVGSSAVSVIDSQHGTFLLPHGAQLSRNLASSSGSVRLISRPFFGTTASSWAQLQLGQTTLTFVKTPAGGGMVLLADTPLSSLPSISLDVDGQSLQEIDLSLSFSPDKHQVTLSFAGNSYQLAASGQSSALTVLLSSGSEHDWIINDLEVSASSPAASAEPSIVGLTTSPSGNAPQVNSAQQAASKGPVENSRELFQARDLRDAEAVLFSNNRAPANTGAWSLESGIKLMQMATSMVNRHDRATARFLLPAVASLLSDAETKMLAEGDPRTASRAQTLLGATYELITGDVVVAEKAYRTALIDDPKSTLAIAAVARFDNFRGGKSQ